MVMQSIVRLIRDKRKRFVTLDYDTVNDYRLSLEACGLLARMLSLPDDWQFYQSEMQERFNVGKDKLRRILGELLTYGYAFKHQRIGNESHSGQFNINDWMVFEFPRTPEEIKNIFTSTDFTSASNKPIPNTHKKPKIYKKEKYKKESSATPSPVPTQASSPPVDLPKEKPKKEKRSRVFPKKELIDRRVEHPDKKIFEEGFKRPLVATSKAFHDELVQKHGSSIVGEIYAFLADHSIEHAIRDNKPYKGDDEHQLKTWAIDKYFEQKAKGGRVQKSDNPHAVVPPKTLSTIESNKQWAQPLKKMKFASDRFIRVEDYNILITDETKNMTLHPLAYSDPNFRKVVRQRLIFFGLSQEFIDAGGELDG